MSVYGEERAFVTFGRSGRKAPDNGHTGPLTENRINVEW